ncbi:MAG: low molecular weight protein-tyrosine-phosphatase [Alphaproteobacteria bacterium]
MKVLFVCLGNICRSPSAEGVARARAIQQGVIDRFTFDSAGTGDWHVGKSPDSRAQAAALARGYELTYLRARQVSTGDFYEFDLILAMDKDNLADLQRIAPDDGRADLRMMLDYAPQFDSREVPDPYYGGEDGFDQVLDMLEEAVDGLLSTAR